MSSIHQNSRATSNARRTRRLAAVIASVAVVSLTAGQTHAAIVSESLVALSWSPAPGQVLEYNVFVGRDGNVPNDSPHSTVSSPNVSLAVYPGDDVIVQVAAMYAGNVEGPKSPPSELISRPVVHVEPFDFDGDGRRDELVRDQISGAPTLWMMGATGPWLEVALPSPGATYELAGSADFDGDGQADIAWNDPSSGSLVVWLMAGPAVKRIETVAPHAPGWQATVTGDVSEMSEVRVVWHHQTSGEIRLWLVDPTDFSRVTPVQLSTPIIMPAGVASIESGCDLDGDLVDEIIWKTQGGTHIVLWMDDAGTVGGSRFDLAGAKIRGCGRFAPDQPKGILCEDAQGRPGVWQLTSVAGFTALGELHPLPRNRRMQLAGNGDFDGDADEDLLYWDPDRGRAQVMLLDGTTFVEGQRFQFEADAFAVYEQN